MNYTQGNLWDFQSSATPVCVTTNGMIKKNGELVMGKGIALQAKQRYPALPADAAQTVKMYGNIPIYFPAFDIITFPTKNDWRDPSDINLIQNSCHYLTMLTNHNQFNAVYLTPPGCGNGGLHWGQVEPILSPILDDRFWIVLQ